MAVANLTTVLRNAEALRTIPIPGAPSVQTRHRWALTGVRAPGGGRVKLQTWRVGGKLLTTPEAVESFILALSGDSPATDADDAIARRGREAGKALKALGC